MKENIIKALIDARTIEALKKKVTLKLLTIAQYMGTPIMGEYGYGSVLPDFWEFGMDDPYDVEKVVDASQNAGELNLGYSYDSLRHGINFEIIVRAYGDEKNQTIHLVRASLNGIVVYLEEENVLKCFAPNQNWEKHMEDLYIHAAKLEERATEHQRAEDAEANKKIKKSFLQKLALIWGYK